MDGVASVPCAHAAVCKLVMSFGDALQRFKSVIEREAIAGQQGENDSCV